jgi:uncharacterized protein
MPDETHRENGSAPANAADAGEHSTSADQRSAHLVVEPIDPRMRALQEEIARAGGGWQEDPACVGAIAMTMFDAPGAKDNVVVAIVPRDRMAELGSQQMVEIRSQTGGDGRIYRGLVTEGPYSVPNGLAPDANPIVITAANGRPFIPDYHGRVYIEILHEMVRGTPMPPRHRPLPASPVFLLGVEETKAAYGLGGDVTLGIAYGHDDLEVRFSSLDKHVLRRHTAILGTTGAGKTTTVASLIGELQAAGVASVLIDTEGEYTAINEPTDDPVMQATLANRRLEPCGIDNTVVYVPVGRQPSNPRHPQLRRFTIRFDGISPYMVMGMLDLTEPQQERYMKAYDIARRLMNDSGIFPTNDAERARVAEIDDFTTGYPNLTLAYLYDVVRACAEDVGKSLTDDQGHLAFRPQSPLLRDAEASARLVATIKRAQLQHDVRSWRKIQGALSRHLRLGIYDRTEPGVAPLDFVELTHPGRVSIIDLGDTESRDVKNLAIAELMRGIVDRQDDVVTARRRAREGDPEGVAALPRVVLLIEEAHEFLSEARIRQMPELVEQVNRIARRGRKRGVGLAFITQMPQHLPNEVVGLVNNFLIHRISNDDVIRRLKGLVGDIGDAMWSRVSTLAPGQSLVKMASMPRPLITAMDPARCRLLMVD